MTLVGGFFVASHVPGTSLSSRTSKTSCCPDTNVPPSPSHILRHEKSGETNELTSDLSEKEETELDFIMDDLNESIEIYDDDDNDECSPKNNKTVVPDGQMFGHLNWLLQTKDSPTSSVNNGILLRNYLDDNGMNMNVEQKNHTKWSWITELLLQSISQYKVVQNHDKDTFDTTRIFPAIWLKFI